MTTLKKFMTRAIAATAAFAVVASPAFVGAATDTTVINATVNSTITISNSTDPVTLALNPTASAVESIGSDVLTVNTNDTDGYTLEISSSDANANLVSGGNNITPGGSATTGGATTALSVNTWGWCAVGVTACDGSYTTGNDQAPGASFVTMKAFGSEDTVKTTSTTATNDTTTVYYGVHVNSSQPDGLYTDTVTYTATVNP